MTKKELELENKFLKLQLKIINAISNMDFKTNTEVYENLGHINYYSKKENFMNSLEFIKTHNLEYNFYNELEKIDY